MHGHDSQPIETLKLSDQAKAKLIAAVDAQGTQQQAQSPARQGERRNLRVRYQGRNVLITMNPLGACVCYSVVPRNLSRGGLAFVHGRFIYPNTLCSVRLETMCGRPLIVDATVVRCRHLAGIAHEVSLKFDEPIDLNQFVTLTPEEAARHAQENGADLPVEAVDTPAGRVLLVDDFATDRKLLGMLLGRSGLTVTDAQDHLAGVRAMAEERFDLAMIDLHLGKEDGLELVRQFRKDGFKGPIVAISADGSDAAQARAMEAGANAFLVKPIDPQRLSDMVGQLLSAMLVNTIVDEPIHSTLAQDKAMRPLVREFVEGLAASIERLRSAGGGEDPDTLRDVCQQLKGAGSSYGFGAVTKTAALVIESLDDDTRQVEAVRQQVQELIGLLGRVRFV